MWEVKSVQLLICEGSEFHLLELRVSHGLLFSVLTWIFWRGGRCLEICASLLRYNPVITVLFNDIVSSFTVAEFTFQVITFDFYSSSFQVCLFSKDTLC